MLIFAAAEASGFDFSVFFWLLVIATMVAMVARYIRIPYALALVITGLIVSPFHVLSNVVLEPHILFTVFLPPLLFESAINLRVKLLIESWKPVAAYAILGTLVSALIVGFLVSWLLNIPLAVGLVFGALISPTDPISVIAIFKELGVGKRLSLIMESESLFNDGLAIVLFTILVNTASGQEVSLLEGIQSFVTVVVGGAAVGAGIGFAASRLTREFDDHLFEIMLTTIVAFGAFLSAETLGVSGVIAVVAAGLVMGSYGMPSGMSPSTRLAVNSFWEYLAFAVNSIVFLLVGFEVTTVDLTIGFKDVLFAVIAVLTGRAAAIYLLSPIINKLRGDIPFTWQHVLFWGGLRGAIPMALVLGLVPAFPLRSELLLITFGVVIFSLLAQGLSIKGLIRRLGLAGAGGLLSEQETLASQIIAIEAALEELDVLRKRKRLTPDLYDLLTREYHDRLQILEHNLIELSRTEESLAAHQIREARIRALKAEKSSLQESRSHGLLDEQELQKLSADIDSELDALKQKHLE